MKCFKRRPEPFAGSYPYQKAIISIHFSYDFFYRWQDLNDGWRKPNNKRK
ncbi:hypothetical protein MITSMUL_03471 [Mitsuokella multacida DSM 20544]|uniref:Uncharacterized protein n=1 Tax=Mitsuokella multacida DSM 20544 TaxID=500635 RepID=C9KJX3_9FIRM|nr:hypothetical protein MITSMUL_03471 [Mitsuokella multacida DSM 20544]